MVVGIILLVDLLRAASIEVGAVKVIMLAEDEAMMKMMILVETATDDAGFYVLLSPHDV